MEELKLSQMLQCQYELWQQHQNEWGPMTPKTARDSLLWMIEELGEVIAIIKKRGEDEIMNDDELKCIFTEELVDVFMYFLDVLNRYDISGNDFSHAYVKKHQYNRVRDYKKQHSNFKK